MCVTHRSQPLSWFVQQNILNESNSNFYYSLSKNTPGESVLTAQQKIFSIVSCSLHSQYGSQPLVIEKNGFSQHLPALHPEELLAIWLPILSFFILSIYFILNINKVSFWQVISLVVVVMEKMSFFLLFLSFFFFFIHTVW